LKNKEGSKNKYRIPGGLQNECEIRDELGPGNTVHLVHK